MTTYSRRFIIGSALAATVSVAACGNGIGSRGPETIDARVDATLQSMYANYPNTVTISDKAVGMLVMPLITEAGLGIGGGYGRGALRVGGVSVDYYSATRANVGLQIGAQQYSHVLFFMTQDALADFRRSQGWAAGADFEVAAPEGGETFKADTTTALAPVIAVVFGQSGLRIGATIEGTKYTRIIP